MLAGAINIYGEPVDALPLDDTLCVSMNMKTRYGGVSSNGVEWADLDPHSCTKNKEMGVLCAKYGFACPSDSSCLNVICTQCISTYIGSDGNGGVCLFGGGPSGI